MTKLLLTLMLVFVAKIASSQNNKHQKNWPLTVIDSVTKKGIEGATVTVGITSHFMADVNGKVNIDVNLIKQNNLITVSCVGYKVLVLNPQIKGTDPDTLVLSAANNSLKEIIISNFSKISLGNGERIYEGGYLPGPDQEIVEYISNIDKVAGTIVTLEYGLKNDHKGIEKPFKVNLYSKRIDDMLPGEPLIKDSIIVYNPEKLAVIKVDISKYNIQIPDDGFFIGFQTLSPTWYGNDFVNLMGHKYLRIPGIKGKFNDRKFRFDERERKTTEYSLFRNIDISSYWAIFEDGTNFAMGAIIDK